MRALARQFDGSVDVAGSILGFGQRVDVSRRTIGQLDGFPGMLECFWDARVAARHHPGEVIVGAGIVGPVFQMLEHTVGAAFEQLVCRRLLPGLDQ